MPRSCSICTHDRTAEISKELAAGASIRGISSRFGVTAAAAHRHLNNCLRITRRAERPAEKPRVDRPQDSPADSSRFASLEPTSLVAATARLVDEALDLLEHAKRADDRRTALVALREARDGLALLMKTAGMLAGEGTSIVVDARKQTIAMLGKLTEDELRALARGGVTTLENVTDNRSLSAAPQAS